MYKRNTDYSIPIKLRHEWQLLSEKELEQMLLQRLKNPVLPTTQANADWENWMFNICFDELRPSADRLSRPLDCCRWSAFCLRYLHPIVNHTSMPLTGEQVLELINGNQPVLQTLMFGTRDQIISMLRGESYLEMNLDEDQQELLNRVKQRSEIYDGKTGRNWADGFVKMLAHFIYHTLHSIDHQALHTVLSSVVNPKNIREFHTVSTHLERFAYFLEITENSNQQLYHGLALGYYNEFKARLELIERYIPNPLGIGLFLIVIYALLLIAQLGPLLTTILMLLVLTLIFSLFYGRLFALIIDTFNWAKAAQTTLEQLLAK
jgi:hypothetical protein